MKTLAAISLALVLCIYYNPAFSQEKVTLGTGVRTVTTFYLPVMAAQEKGFFKEQGLEVDWTAFVSGTPLAHAVLAKAIETGIEMSTSIIINASRGVPEAIVADLGAPQSWYLWSRADGPIKKPTDLKGGRIGISRLGSLTEAYTLAILKGLGMEKDVKIVATGGVPQRVAALQAGVVHAVVGSVQVTARLEVEGIAKRVVPLADYVPKEWDPNVIFAALETISRRPATVKKVVTSLLKGADFAMANPEWATSKILAQMGGSPKVAEVIYSGVRYNKSGTITPQHIEKMRQFLIDYGLVPKEKVPPARELYSDKFVPVEQ